MLDYQLTNFNNGLKVITAPLPKTKAVTVLFLFGVGSRFESPELNGISHFLEHMYFKGTEKRPTTLDISRELDSVGAGFNAYTGEEYTGFYVRVTAEHFDLGLDILSDILYHSKFDEKEIEREKGVIIEEINMYNDDPRAKIEDVAKELVYPDHPLGRNIAGSKKTVGKFKRDDFIKYRQTFYQPSNCVIAIAGGGEPDKWLTEIKKRFENLPDQKMPAFEKVIETQNKPALALEYKKTDQAHFILAFRAINRTDPRRPVNNVLTNLMGQMMSSRLFIEIRERRGLCYYINANVADYRDVGAWFVSAGVDLARIEEAITVILEEIKKLKDTAVTDEELLRAKENLKGHMFLSLEESMAVASLLAEQQMFLGEIKDPDVLAKEIDAVTRDDIQKFAQEFFIKETLNLAVIGPFRDKQKFNKIIEEF